MAIEEKFSEQIIRIIKEKFGIEMNKDDFKVERPPANQWGDYGTNAGFIVGKKTGSNPAEAATIIAEEMGGGEFVKEARFLKPGYTNWEVENGFYKRETGKIAAGTAYFNNAYGEGKTINAEFVSANPVGPLNVVSGRAAAYGDALCSMLSFCGYKVTRENYVNDHGRQMKLFGLSLKARYFEKHGWKAEFPEDGYMGDYVRDIAAGIDEKRPGTYEEVKTAVENNDEQGIEGLFREYGLNFAKEWQAGTLEKFGVKFDTWFSENSLYETAGNGSMVKRALDKLSDSGMLYEKEGAVWFETTKFGDDKDRVVKKSDGDYTYFASDIAYVENKFERGADMIVNILGPDHHGYVKRLESIVQALGHKREELKVIILQQVNLMEGGEKKKMSKREGRIVTLDELVSEVGADAARYFFLMRNYNSHLDFDIELAKEQSDKNPVFYIQYAYARICNIFVRSKEKYKNLEEYPEGEIDFTVLEQEEKDLIRMMLELPDALKEAALKFSPSFFVQKVYDLVSVFHSFYNKHRVVTEDKKTSLKRLYILKSLKNALKTCFDIIGITAKENM